MKSLSGKTIIVTGGSRGIGRAIALRCAKDANIVIVAKTATKHPALPGTIYTVAKEVEEAGGVAFPYQLDIRNDQEIDVMVEKVVAKFGGIDILINNASAISLTPTKDTSLKKFDLMFDVNVRATFACSRAVLPYLMQSSHSHILNISPPLNMYAKWFKNHVAYTISKYGMSMCTLGMAEELKAYKIAVNSLWPKTTIATSAVKVNFPKEILEASRTVDIMADAAHAILSNNDKNITGNFFIDEEILRQNGINNFDKYSLNPGSNLFTDLYID